MQSSDHSLRFEAVHRLEPRQHCDHPECGCPLAALAPELARADEAMKVEILGELANYKDRMLPFMPVDGLRIKSIVSW